MRVLLSIFIVSLLAACTTTGNSVGGSVSAPITVKQPDFVHPEISAYARRIISPLIASGFRVGYTEDPDALKLEINFDPDPYATAISINLIKPGVGVIAHSEAVNHGWGTMMARSGAIKDLVESATDEFNQQLISIRFIIASDKHDFQSCFNDMAASPNLALIKGKVGVESLQAQTFSMLADNSKPTEQEKLALIRWGNMRDVCLKMMHESMVMRGVPLAIINVWDASYANTQLLLVELSRGNLTYSEFAQKRADLAASANDKVAQISNELQKQNEDSRFKANQLYIEQQKANAERQRAYAEQQKADTMQLQTLKPTPLPASNQINCTSHAIGNTVNTNCY